MCRVMEKKTEANVRVQGGKEKLCLTSFVMFLSMSAGTPPKP